MIFTTVFKSSGIEAVANEIAKIIEGGNDSKPFVITFSITNNENMTSLFVQIEKSYASIEIPTLCVRSITYETINTKSEILKELHVNLSFTSLTS